MVIGVLTACGINETDAVSEGSTSTSPTSLPTQTSIGDPVDNGSGTTVGHVPQDILDEIIRHAAEVTSIPPGELKVVSAESVTWPDGSLGCPEPGFSYTQALVDGYQVGVMAGDAVLDYRASTTGTFKLCPGLSVPNSPDK
jgi:hypothetical protein